MDGFFGFPCDLGGILVYDVKISDGGQRVMEILTMFKYGWGSRLRVFLDSLTTKNHQIKKFNYLQDHSRYRNTPVPGIIRKKWVINLSSKPPSDGEQSLLQKGPKFAVSSSKVPLTEYIAVTKRICDELGENTAGRDCTEIYQKTKEVLQTLQGQEGANLQHHQKGQGGHQNPQGRLLPCGTNSRQGG